jgi:hypothetical protein
VSYFLAPIISCGIRRRQAAIKFFNLIEQGFLIRFRSQQESDPFPRDAAGQLWLAFAVDALLEELVSQAMITVAHAATREENAIGALTQGVIDITGREQANAFQVYADDARQLQLCNVDPVGAAKYNNPLLSRTLLHHVQDGIIQSLYAGLRHFNRRL